MGVTGCGSSEGATDGGDKNIKIAILDTEVVFEADDSYINGITMAIEDLNELYGDEGYTISYEFYEDGSVFQTGMEALNQISADSSITAVVGTSSLNILDVAADVLDSAGKLLVTYYSATDSLFENGYTSVFRNCFGESDLGEAIASYAAEQEDIRWVAVYHSDTSYERNMVRGFLRGLEGMELTEEGLIKSINVPYSSNNAKNAANNAVAPQRKANPRDFLTEEILMASSTAKMAELVAKEIYNIRESKNALLRGQADNMPSDGAQLKIMLDNLNLQEEAMTEMFSGVRNKEEKTFTVRLTPDKEFDNEVAFRFSKKLGIVANNDLAGTPFYISLKDLKTVKIPQEDGKKKKEMEGIAYNVPGQAMVTLTDGKKKLYEGEIPVTQFGIIEYLAPVLFNKNSTIKVYFDPVTGGLLKVDREESK